MKNSLILFIVAMFLFVGHAFAADAATPDLMASILALWAAISSHATTALVLVPVFQLLRTHEVLGVLGGLSGRWMQVVVAVITTGGFVVQALASGQGLAQALIAGLLTSGGAMVLFDAIRSIPPAAAKV
jgi:hypothetical protein